jgi:hypothetical protein
MGMDVLNCPRFNFLSGWLPQSKIVRFGADNVYDKTITISAPTSTSSEPQLVRIPFDPQDLQRYYTVEYRVSQSWDSGIPRDVVLVHEVVKKKFSRCDDGFQFDAEHRSYLLTDDVGNPKEDMDENGVKVSVISKDPTAGTAVVRIVSTKPQLCTTGLVWREAKLGDYVCVTIARRTEVANENALAESRREPSGGALGPNTCKSGYVWRDAYAGDVVCVTPNSRDVAKDENAQADQWRIGTAAYGPLSCKAGFVWRGADDRDYVCVSGTRRAAVCTENELASSRRKRLWLRGTYTCKTGFVRREAFPGDRICVPPESRSVAAQENKDRTANLYAATA